jgi:hypothetical protein
MESYADMLGSWSGADRGILTEQAGPDDILGWGFAVEELPRVIDLAFFVKIFKLFSFEKKGFCVELLTLKLASE